LEELEQKLQTLDQKVSGEFSKELQATQQQLTQLEKQF
jgi:hypothetical protein